MMEIVTVSLPYSVTISIIYRHYLLEGNWPVNTLLFPYHL